MLFLNKQNKNRLCGVHGGDGAMSAFESRKGHALAWIKTFLKSTCEEHVAKDVRKSLICINWKKP